MRSAGPSAALGLLLALWPLASPVQGAAEGAPPCPADLPTLDPDRPVEEAIQGNEPHCWRLNLKTGQFVHVTLEQRGLDMVLELYDPEQKLHLMVDTYDNSLGAENLYFEAHVDGRYSLRVRLWSNADEAAAYLLSSSRPRQPSRDDRARLRVEDAFRKAESRRRLYAKSPGRTSRSEYRQLAREYRSLAQRFLDIEDHARAGECLFQSAYLNVHILNNPRLAALDAAVIEGDETPLSLTPAAAIRTEVEDDLRRSIELLQTTSRLQLEAAALRKLGNFLLERADDPKSAIPLQHRALSLWRALEIEDEEANQLNRLGESHAEAGYLADAIGYHSQSLEIFKRIKNQERVSEVLLDQGITLYRSGQVALALSTLWEALERFESQGNPDGIIQALTEIVFIYDTEDLEGADIRVEDLQERVLRLTQRSESPLTKALVFSDLGTILDRAGKHFKARRLFDEALRLYTIYGTPEHQALIFRKIGHSYRREGKVPEAVDMYHRSLEVFEALGNPLRIATTHLGLARVMILENTTKEALKHSRLAIQLIEESNRFASPLQSSRFLAARRRFYDVYIEALKQSDRGNPSTEAASTSFLINERSRALSLRNGLLVRQSEIGNQEVKITEELSRVQRAMISTIRGNTLGASAARSSIKRLERQRTNLLTRLRTTQEARYRDLSDRIEVLEPSFSIEEIQSGLSKTAGTALVSYRLADPQSYMWLVTSDSVNFFALGPERVLEQAALAAHAKVRDTGRTGSGAPSLLRDLSRDLKIDSALREGIERLVIVNDGALSLIPFSILPLSDSHDRAGPPAPGNSQTIVLDRAEVIYAPSATVFVALQNRCKETEKAQKGLAIFADPTYSDPLYEPLPGTRDEAEQIVRHFKRRGAVRFLGCNARKDKLLGRSMSDFQYLHIASHGDLAPSPPEIPFLLLSQVDCEGGPIDGMVQNHDIYRASLRADLVTLSGCGTGLGETIRGEGVVGLAHGFLSAGAASALVSLWKVDDRATARLMGSFYDYLRTEQLLPIEALRKAQIDMRREGPWTEYRHWAGFVLHGIPLD